MILKRSATPAPAALPLPATLAAFVAGGILMVAAAPFLFARLGMRGGLAVSELALVLPSLLVAAAFGLGATDVLGSGRPSARQWVTVVLLVVPLWLAAGGVLMLQQAVVPLPQEILDKFRALHAALRPKDAFDAVLAVATIALAPALAEEFLVRGLLLPSLDRSMPRAIALVLSATAFALLHMDGYRWAFTFLLGLVLGWLRLRTGTLLVPVAVHALFNTITFVVSPYFDDGSNVAEPGAGALLLLGGLTLGLPLGRALHRSFARAGAPSEH